MMSNHRFVFALSLLLVVTVVIWGCTEEPNLTSPNSTTGVNPAGQANFAQNQQVNNGTEPSRARENRYRAGQEALDHRSACLLLT